LFRDGPCRRDGLPPGGVVEVVGAHPSEEARGPPPCRRSPCRYSPATHPLLARHRDTTRSGSLGHPPAGWPGCAVHELMRPPIVRVPLPVVPTLWLDSRPYCSGRQSPTRHLRRPSGPYGEPSLVSSESVGCHRFRGLVRTGSYHGGSPIVILPRTTPRGRLVTGRHACYREPLRLL
jgi:hypothetical protein